MESRHLNFQACCSCFINKAKTIFILLSVFLAVMPSLTITAKEKDNPFAFSHADKIVKGKVTDKATGSPLMGATIREKGTNNSTTTNAEGAYSISVKDNNAILVFTFVGYIPREIATNQGSALDVTLDVASSQLAEVLIGYGTLKKKDVTGSVKSLKTEDFNKGIINSPEQLLQGKVAGVNVTSANGEPGGAVSITVRGPGGVRTGSTPLFVLDGLALDNSGTGGGNPLNFLNPQDIASIDVLKDASATAIYGARGANGVILITTKKGKSGQNNILYSGSLGISSLAHKLPVFSAGEYKKQVVAIGGILDDKGTATDWQDVISRTGVTQNHNLSLNGGSEKLTYFASFGLQNQEGIIKHNDFKRYTGRFNATQKFLNDRLIVEANMTATNTYDLRPDYGTIIGSAISNNPTYPSLDADGHPAIYQNINNPLQSFDLDKEITKINRVIGNITATVMLWKGLSYKLNFGIDNSTGTRDVQALPSLVPQRDGRLETFYTTNRNQLFENYLTYNLDLGDHSLTVLAGQSYQKIFLQGRNYSINKFPISPVEPQYNPGLGQELTLTNNKPGGYALINELQSYFGRMNYQFLNKYLLTATLRADGSSKFGGNNKYGYFPSFSFGWKINEESFMKNSAFEVLKLRAGWGQTGNQEIPSKITQALFTSTVSSSSSYPLTETGPYPGGTIYTRLANPDIQWEVSTQTNIGLDFGLLNGRLNGSLDVFNKNTNKILLQVIPADPIQPANTVWTNVKDMNINNKGIELDLEYRVTNKKGFSYGLGGNITALSNEVTKSPYTVIPSGSASGSGLTSATINGYINNEPIGTFFLKDFTGFNAEGLSTYRDVDGDGIISDKDRIAAGSALPDLLYSFNLTMAFKGFDFAANFNGVSGNKIYDNTANSNFYKLKLFKGLNTTAEAIQYKDESVNNAAPVSTRFLKDGAYLRLNNLALGYTINLKNTSLDTWVKSLRISMTGQNLFVFTRYNGFDPEVNTDRTINGILSYGIDFLSYPKARSLIFGLNVGF